MLDLEGNKIGLYEKQYIPSADHSLRTGIRVSVLQEGAGLPIKYPGP